MNKKIYFYLFVFLSVGIFLFRAGCRTQTRTPPDVLPQNVKEQIGFNEKTHTLTLQTEKGTVKEYANNPVIQIKKDGTVSISRHLAGFEKSYFIGAGVSDCFRGVVGVNLYHFSRFDLGGEVGIVPDKTKTIIKPYIGGGYNLYSNTSLDIGLNPFSLLQRNIDLLGFISVKI